MRPDRRVLCTEYLDMLEEGLLARWRCPYRSASVVEIYACYIRQLVEDKYPEDTEVAATLGYMTGISCCADEAERHTARVIAALTKLGLALDDQHAHTRQVIEGLGNLMATKRVSLGGTIRARGLLQGARKAESALQRRIDNRNALIIVTCWQGENHFFARLPPDMQDEIFIHMLDESSLNSVKLSLLRIRMSLQDARAAEEVNAEPAPADSAGASGAPAEARTGPSTTNVSDASAKGRITVRKGQHGLFRFDAPRSLHRHGLPSKP